MEKNQSNSVLWLHSKEHHQGRMTVRDWETKIISSHRTALNRQVTEATVISNEGVGSLLNSKNEYGANNLAEMVIKVGNYIPVLVRKRKK